MKKFEITQEQIMEILQKCYDAAIEGLPKTPSAQELANEYMNKYPDIDAAVKKMVNTQVIKCTTSGFLTSLGGLITLPVAVPANIASVIYVQLRMIAAIAVMGGYNPSDDAVQTLAYVCLTGTSVSELCKKAGVEAVNKGTVALIKKIPGKVLASINQKMGFRFITKFGEKGIINLGKMVPIAGGVLGGGLDYVETNAIANRAYKLFIMNEVE